MTTFRATYRRTPNGPLITSTLTLEHITPDTPPILAEADVLWNLGIGQHHLYVPLVRKCHATAAWTGQPCQKYCDSSTPFCATHTTTHTGAAL